MAETFVGTLESISQMVTPSDVLGAQKLSSGKKVDSTVVKELIDALYGMGSQGVLSMPMFVSRLNELLSKVPADDKATLQEINRVLRVYSSDNSRVDKLSKAAWYFKGRVGKETATFQQIIGKDVPNDKKMGIILSNSSFISPVLRNVDRVETFMNFMPTIHVSRMVPYLDVEFVFDRPKALPLQTASQLKFLLGADKQSVASGPNKAMLDAQIISTTEKNQSTVAGMELFTSPQTLVNPTPVNEGSRYVDVLDPMRPFASLMSFNISVESTVGLFSYKKGTLVFKLHDRSRLAEISDFIKPEVYARTTLWITYGWRYPVEPGGRSDAGSSTYSDFINNNMLVRESYGIINSQISFDQVGQVTITLQIFAKGAAELRTMKTTADRDEELEVMERIREVARNISEYKRALNLGPAEGVSREIRGFQLLSAAEAGTFPDIATEDILSNLKALEDSFRAKDAKIDKNAANKLINELKKFYQSTDKKQLDFKSEIDRQAKKAVEDKFKEVLSGADPFLPFVDGYKEYAEDAGLGNVEHPFIKKIEEYNKDPLLDPSVEKRYHRKVVSFGKLFSVFAGASILTLPNIDELQVLFYQMNESAGDAACTNIAEFPIDMPVFMSQYDQLVSRTGSTALTLERFFELVRDAQLTDERAIAYGFRSFFEKYKQGEASKLVKSKESSYERELLKGFKKPVIEFYIETSYAAFPGTHDLLTQFEAQATDAGRPNSNASGGLTRVMRIHIFDKQSSPYKLAGSILRSDSSSSPEFLEVEDSYVSAHSQDPNKALASLKSVLGETVSINKGQTQIDLRLKGFSNEQLKKFVSRTVPTITYGTNASSVISAEVSTKNDPLMAATQIMGVNKTGRPNTTQPNGSGVGGLPLRIIPAAMTMTTLGCPLLTYGQQFFVDFNTGTTIDNIYIVTGLQHNISPGRFDSQLTLSFHDAYGKFEGAQTIADWVKKIELP